MDYFKHYNLLIKKAQMRDDIDGYTELHHIIPKCMGGNNKLSNLVALTPEEHYVAHQLLCKAFPNESKLAYAAWAMTCKHPKASGSNTRNNKLYGWIKRKMVDANKKNNVRPPSRKGIPFTEEQKAKLKGRESPMKGKKGVYTHTEEWKQLRSKEIELMPDDHPSVLARFKKGQIPWNKGKILPSRPGKKCSIDGVYYQSMGEASRTLGIPLRTIDNRIKSEAYPNYVALT